ncbi:hypothetical protein D917_09865, partial [Trichinella nativa]
MTITAQNTNQQSTQRSIVIRTVTEKQRQQLPAFTSTPTSTLSSPSFMQDMSMTDASAATDLSDLTSSLLVPNFKTPTSRNPFKRTSQSSNTFTDDGESIFDKSTPKKRLLTKYDQKTTTA